MNETWTPADVAAYLKIAENTVIRRVENGDLPGEKVGGSWRFDRVEIEHWTKLPDDKKFKRTDTVLASLLNPERIKILHAKTKTAALAELIDVCLTIPGVNSRQELTEAIYQREQLMSTGVGLSIAMPHVRLESVRNVSIALGVNASNLTDYETLDNLPVRIIVLIIAGGDQNTQYIQTLAYVSRILKDADIRAQLIQARIPEELYDILVH